MILSAALVAAVVGEVPVYLHRAGSATFGPTASGHHPQVVTLPKMAKDEPIPQALLESKLAYLADGDCFVTTAWMRDIKDGYGMAIWPHGTVGVHRNSRFGVKVPGEPVIWVGDRFTAVGSFVREYIVDAAVDAVGGVDPVCRPEHAGLYYEIAFSLPAGDQALDSLATPPRP